MLTDVTLNLWPLSSHELLLMPEVSICFFLLQPPIIPILSSLSHHDVDFYSTKNRSNQKRISLQVDIITSIHLKAFISIFSVLFGNYGSTVFVCFSPGHSYSYALNPVPATCSRTLSRHQSYYLLLFPVDYFHYYKHSFKSPILKWKKKTTSLTSHLPPNKATKDSFHWWQNSSKCSSMIAAYNSSPPILDTMLCTQDFTPLTLWNVLFSKSTIISTLLIRNLSSHSSCNLIQIITTCSLKYFLSLFSAMTSDTNYSELVQTSH